MQPAEKLHDGMAADADSATRYLIFELGKELYGAPLQSVCEVIKLGSVKPVPYMRPHFTGIVNLRGAIVSVIDLRVKFGLTKAGTGLVVTVQHDQETIGAIVDDVVSVTTIAPTDIKRDINVSTKIPLNFFLGVGRTGDRLVNLIDIAGVLDGEDMAAIRRKNDAQARG